MAINTSGWHRGSVRLLEKYPDVIAERHDFWKWHYGNMDNNREVETYFVSHVARVVYGKGVDANLKGDIGNAIIFLREAYGIYNIYRKIHPFMKDETEERMKRILRQIEEAQNANRH